MSGFSQCELNPCETKRNKDVKNLAGFRLELIHHQRAWFHFLIIHIINVVFPLKTATCDKENNGCQKPNILKMKLLDDTK